MLRGTGSANGGSSGLMEKEMTSRYVDVVGRVLSEAERGFPTDEQETPFVIEPLESTTTEFLSDFLSRHSEQVLADIAKHGALLIRGFDIASSAEFERLFLSIRGMTGMDELLLSEAGRTLTDGTRFVFHTNALIKTGGAANFDDFHSENYFAPDVPHYIGFFCLTPSDLGGETGLVNLRKVYADLPDRLKQELERGACFAARYALEDMERRYRLPAHAIEAFCEEVGLPIVSEDGVDYVAIHKPSVIEHPVTQEKVLLLNFFNIPNLLESLVSRFMPDYQGKEWFRHRLIWRFPQLAALVHPDGVLRTLYRRARYRTAHRAGSNAQFAIKGQRWVGTLLTSDDIQLIAESIRRRFSSFRWKAGDLLILDNLQIAHAGMPGRGKRVMRVMLCNPVPLPYSAASPGLHRVVETGESLTTLGRRLIDLRDAHPAGTGEPIGAK
nr:TauD/TfdA family dioxygenase [Rhizobium laguerreae]